MSARHARPDGQTVWQALWVFLHIPAAAALVWAAHHPVDSVSSSFPARHTAPVLATGPGTDPV